MTEAQCVAIIAALYQHAASITPEMEGIDNSEAVTMAADLLQAAKRVVPNV